MVVHVMVAVTVLKVRLDGNDSENDGCDNGGGGFDGCDNGEKWL